MVGSDGVNHFFACFSNPQTYKSCLLDGFNKFNGKMLSFIVENQEVNHLILEPNNIVSSNGPTLSIGKCTSIHFQNWLNWNCASAIDELTSLLLTNKSLEKLHFFRTWPEREFLCIINAELTKQSDNTWDCLGFHRYHVKLQRKNSLN